ncbi:T9SS type A sorting domain-containing protein [Chryseobacterium sp. SN22]|uniref:T9SS type A sorting domain-containing protein n=1 Tax=Chryseobacterium sp. SN22 TaxID=2606431 RepID=UPI0011EC7AF7|nr:T9SS type A sorting domain-containing protein [Chryseobacterium sp. SN22]KAA0127151.1 T9SS type A sorting domain-containing protein [Chryseobacterium sp. SN22]
MNKLFNSFCMSGAMLLLLTNNTKAQACSNADPGNTPGDLGCVSFIYQGQPVTYTTVRSADGEIWLQQNMGSSKVAASINDTEAYGDLFQWGRWDDGHQLRNSAIVATAPAVNDPSGLNGGNSGFYSAGSNSFSNWWSEGAPNDQWTAANPSSATATNGADPCKAMGAGWRLPLGSEIETVLAAENISDTGSAFSSHLKMVPAGMKDYNGIFSPGARLYLWSSSSSPYTGSGQHLYISMYSALTNSSGRDGGMSVRCMKEISSLSVSDLKKKAIGIYPNPTSGILYLNTDAAVENIYLIAITGQIVKVQAAEGKIDISNVPAGVYTAEVVLKNGEKIIRKVIKN